MLLFDLLLLLDGCLLLCIYHLLLFFFLALETCMVNLNLAADMVTTANQHNSSAFIKHMPYGFGYLPTFIRYDPTHFMDRSLHSILIPTASEIDTADSIPVEGERAYFATWGETEAGGITAQFSNVARKYGLQMNGQKQLRTRGLSNGISSDDSYEDFHTYYGNMYTTVMENKGAEGSILAAIVEAASTGTNFAMGLFTKGFEASHVVIPIIATTGLCMVFGAVVLLDHSFPTYIPLSKRLDVSDPYESKVAAAFLVKSQSHCQLLCDMSTNLTARSTEGVKMVLDGSKYFIKSISDLTYQRGLGLFDANNNFHDIQSGVIHMVKVLNKLYANPATRDIPEYPLSIRTPDKCARVHDEHYSLIYRDLKNLGYKAGCPNRVTNSIIFGKFVDRFKEIVHALYHDAGVIHGDLYASNIMWKCTDDIMYIKIVDWDGAHCKEELDFSTAARKSLEEYFKFSSTPVLFDENHDLLFVRVFDEAITSENEHQWLSMASAEKAVIDAAFYSLFKEMLQRA